MEFIAYLVAPPVAILMDSMYYDGMKNIIFGFLSVKRKYLYKDFLNYRLIGIIISSLAIAYAGLNKDLMVGMVGAAVFILFHCLIYVDMYRREMRSN